tara:strand:+ start:9 stop:1649 length:1641 start_codon:yes stop_codon:yes gene_type:complete
MITIIFFIFFYFTIYFNGRGIFLITKSKLTEPFGIPINYFYPLISLFYIGNASLMVNFFYKIDTFISLTLLLLPIIYNFSSFKYFKISQITFKNIISFLATPLIIGISSSNINLAYDAGLYHLNHQNWIRNFKIVLGLSNNHNRYGYSSIIEYINVNFWLNENYILIHFVNLIFIVFIFQLIYYFLFTKYYKFAVSILIYGLLDNFGFNGGKNGFIEIESITKQDTPFAIMFITSSILLYFYFNKSYQDITHQEVYFLFFLTLFSVELRILGAINLLAFIIISINKFKFVQTLKYFFTTALFGSIIGFLFIIKNILTSSCIFYPIKQLCINQLSWSGIKGYANPGAEADTLASFHKAMNLDNLTAWVGLWTSKEVNLIVGKNLILTIGIILFFNLIHKSVKKEEISSDISFYFIYCVISVAVWLFTAPSVRWGVGIFMTLVLFISIFYKTNHKSYFIERYYFIMTLCYLLVLVLVPQTNNYYSLYENIDSFNIVNIQAPEIEYRENLQGFGVLPEKGDQCWVNLECVRNPNVTKEEIFSYIIFKDE